METNQEATQAQTEQAVETTEQVQAEAAQETAELYELPDGRKVDAATLANEWKSQFMPDYTRKSQELAALKRGTAQQPPQAQQQANPDYSARPWEDPNYQPQTVAELLEVTDRRNAWIAEQREAAQAAEQQRIDQAIESQLAEIRKLDPEASSDLVFAHATKYGFTNLVNAYQNMKAFNVAVRQAEQKTAANVAKRAANGQFAQGASGAAITDAPVWGDTETPLQMLRRLNGG